MPRPMLASAAAIALLTLVGCATNAPDAADEPSTTSPSAVAGSPDPAAPSESSDAPGADAEDWEMTTVGDGAVTLRMPPGWTAQVADPDRLVLLDEAGDQQISALVDREGFGAGDLDCTPDLRPDFTVIEQTEVDAPPGEPLGASVVVAATVEAIEGSGGPAWRFSAGLTNSYTLADDTCEVYYEVAMEAPINYAAIQVVPDPLDALDFPSMDAALAYAESSEFALLRQILSTVEFTA